MENKTDAAARRFAPFIERGALVHRRPWTVQRGDGWVQLVDAYGKPITGKRRSDNPEAVATLEQIAGLPELCDIVSALLRHARELEHTLAMQRQQLSRPPIAPG